MMKNALLTACLVLTLFSAKANAADGPVLSQVRGLLTTPGTVLLDHEDAATMTVALAAGSTSELVTVPATEGLPVDKAVRVRVGQPYDVPYRVQVFSDTTAAPVHKGDAILISFFQRAPETTGVARGLADFYLQTTSGAWQSPCMGSMIGHAAWKQVFASAIATGEYAAGGLQVAFHLGKQQQVLDLAGLVVLNLGPGIDISKLPRTAITWRGMESDAPWRVAAQQRIEQYRMADLSIRVLDADGRPVANTPVHVQQLKRDFTIGSFTGYLLLDATPNGQHLRDTFLRLFNRATTPIYWADWGWPTQQTKYLALANWLAQNHFTTRGHVMIYPTFQNMPADVVALKTDPPQMAARILQQIRDISAATKPFGFREYDVTNELRDCTDVTNLLGPEVVPAWYAEARRAVPEAKLALNENTLLANGGDTGANQEQYLGWYNFLKAKGQAPDVLGFQGHFDEDVTAPEDVYAILDRFSAATDAELQITEFDFNTLDEQAQAAYTRDFMTICFSHPRITGFTMWGFWQGDQWRPQAAFYRTDWSPKPNARMLEELLTKTWWTDTTVVTDGNGTVTVKAFLGQHNIAATIADTRVEANVNLPAAGKTVPVTLVAPGHKVIGRATTPDGLPLAGVGVQRTGSRIATVTNSAGYYTLPGVPGETYTITPALTSYTFSPPTRSVSVSNADVTGQNFIGKTGVSLNGRIATSTSLALAGASVSRGSGYPIATTNSAGYYTFIGVQPGSYTITPGKTGYRFIPISRTLTAGSSDISGLNFIGATGYNVNGRIANSAGTGISGISVRRSGSNAAVSTNSAGYYTFIDVPNGTHTISPSGTGLSFSPELREVTINGADVSGQNYTVAPGYSLSGRVATSSGAALAGVSVTRSGSGFAVFTNSAGYYVLPNVPAGTHTITPVRGGYSFAPTSKSVTATTADVTGQNFTGSAG